MADVPIEVELSKEWGEASTLLRIFYAEARPRSGERTMPLGSDETHADAVLRAARAFRLPLRPADAEAIAAEGARLGLINFCGAAGDVAVVISVPSAPPSVVATKRPEGGLDHA